MDNQLYQWEEKIRPVYYNAHPISYHNNRLHHSLDQHTNASDGKKLKVSCHWAVCHSGSIPSSYSVQTPLTNCIGKDIYEKNR